MLCVFMFVMLYWLSRKESEVPMEPTSAEAIRIFAEREYVAPARQKGARSLKITAGDVHRGMRLKNRVPNVCSVLGSKIFLERNGLAIEEVAGPPSGMGTRVIYTYRFVRNVEEAQPGRSVQFGALRGLLKEALHPLGGGEAFLRRERERFYQPDRTDGK